MRTSCLVRRNIALFFREKGLFFTSLITPVILLVLYVSFLGNVYRDVFQGIFSAVGISVSPDLLDGSVGGQLVSSLLAVSCVTVSFCSNFVSVQDKATGARRDLQVSPVSRNEMSLAYYLASVFSSLIVCFTAAALCFTYLGVMGWFLSLTDVLLILLDVVLLVLFGTALSSVINVFLSTQGQISAVGSIVSSCYGFLCGAYMPISQFSPALQKVISFLPGTYGTSLLRNHAMRGVFREMRVQNLPEELIREMENAMDCRVYFFSEAVSVPVMYAILGGTILFLLGVYLLIHRKVGKKEA